MQREAQPFAEATVGLQGGRATANREIVPAVVTAGRAATHRGGMAGPEPVGARPLPSTDAGGTNVGVGRGASRGHEQRNVVFTRPTKEFSKIGTSLHIEFIYYILRYVTFYLSLNLLRYCW